MQVYRNLSALLTNLISWHSWFHVMQIIVTCWEGLLMLLKFFIIWYHSDLLDQFCHVAKGIIPQSFPLSLPAPSYFLDETHIIHIELFCSSTGSTNYMMQRKKITW